MNTRLGIRSAALLAGIALLAGCSGTPGGDTPSSVKPLEFRLVTSSVDGTCDAPALTTDGAGRACDTAGTITYELGRSLGTVTPTSVTSPTDQASTHSVILELSTADTSTLGTVSGGAVGKKLAILLDGRVLSAPLVAAPITTSPLTLAFGSASQAAQTAAAIKGPETP
jgi:preprotein translocase subunit SecD